MSAIASATLIRKSDLARLAELAKERKTSLFGKPKDTYAVFIAANGRRLEDYASSGYILATVLCYLDEERHSTLMESEFQALAELLTAERAATHFLLTAAHKQWVPALDPANFDEHVLKEYFNAFNDTDEPAVGRPMLDCIRFLRDTLSSLDADHVAILTIG